MVLATTAIYSLQRNRLHGSLVDLYKSLTHEQLSLLCSLRSLPLTGDLATSLANHDLNTYGSKKPLGIHPSQDRQHSVDRRQLQTSLKPKGPDLPVELIAEILDHIGDWELSTALGLPTALPRPIEWTRAAPMDEAILTGYLPLVRTYATTEVPFTKIGAHVILRFGFIHIIEHLRAQHPKVSDKIFGSQGWNIPVKASQFNQVNLLSWWRNHPDFIKVCSAEVIDNASKSGAVTSLDWWLHSSGITLNYTEAALEGASLRGHIDVLNWWKSSGLPLKIGKVMESASTSGEVEILDWWLRSGLEQPKYEKQALYLASCHERVAVLQWWLESGLQMIYDGDVLVGATRMNRPSVLEWWDHSGLPVPYRLCDIEEALEDAIGGGEQSRAWWTRKGVDFNAADAEWMKTQILNSTT